MADLLSKSLLRDALNRIESRKAEGENFAILYGINRYLLSESTIKTLREYLEAEGYKTKIHSTHNVMVEWQ